jgi:ribose 5-phosphate isomerase B
MKIYLGADHAGFDLKTQIFEHLHHAGYDVEDVGAHSLDQDDDYPHYALQVATKVLGEEGDQGRGILICGSGQGMSMAANRVQGIRAALAWNADSARAAKEDDDANILVLPSRFVAAEEAFAMADAWLEAKFKADPKYRRRLDELGDIRG